MGAEEYRLSEIDIYSRIGCDLYIKEITEKYVRFSTRQSEESSGLDIAIHFDLDDKDDIEARDEIKKVYDWHMNYCDNCKSGKDAPAVSCELVLKATLEELAGMKSGKHKIPTPAEAYNNPELAFVGSGVGSKNKEKS